MEIWLFPLPKTQYLQAEGALADGAAAGDAYGTADNVPLAARKTLLGWPWFVVNHGLELQTSSFKWMFGYPPWN